ncbi:hypothetical protein M406DRAFT_334340 [Cryphonectria parasitica EP155]|uniref:Saposin B-type domain-containing protein n=1 Tax=Cryphonectria parasitica (strain ATCC 38755 / EP155) TaxID=660469 RepID=A0A9P5CKF5_CRYP1|nr:uncharacterized protein M406DRAFT_334340 [Cryphonectria parasitica EP155]KAF3760715.1 hypothetical protein M406DRAFT_334340 [Cryphonectria parasitica EP155]
MAARVARMLGLFGAMVAFSTTPVSGQLFGTVNCVLCQVQAETALASLDAGVSEPVAVAELKNYCNGGVIQALDLAGPCDAFLDAFGFQLVQLVAEHLDPETSTNEKEVKFE